jgi:type I restriction enzyme M protein
VIDKRHAQARKGIFMIDASGGFAKDGPKNRLRDQDIHRIVDVFNRCADVPKYARMVAVEEIERNDFNLNLPRYIDSSTPEDIQDIAGHLRGGIPARDIDALADYWTVCPGLERTLFKTTRKGYLALKVDAAKVRATIFGHPEFIGFSGDLGDVWDTWRKQAGKRLKTLKPGFVPKALITELSEGLLAHYASRPLIDPYDIYQHLMDYWTETLQDDAYLIAADGWKAETSRIVEKDKRGRERDKGWTCDLVPKPLVVARFFAREQAAIDTLTTELEQVTARLAELEEEHGGDEGAFAELDKVNRAEVARALRENGADDPAAVWRQWLELSGEEGELKRRIKNAEAELDALAYARYARLTEAEIQTLVVDDKWLATLAAAVRGEVDRVSQRLAQRVRELAERYAAPLPRLSARVAELEARVDSHLAKMGFEA